VCVCECILYVRACVHSFFCVVFAKALEAGINTLKTLYRESVALGLTSAEDAKARMTKLKPSISYTDLREVDMVHY